MLSVQCATIGYLNIHLSFFLYRVSIKPYVIIMFYNEYLFTLLLVIVFVYFVYITYSNRNKKFSYWKDRGVPFLEPDWLFGNVRSELLKRSTWSDFSTKCYNAFKDNGFGGIYFFSKPVLIVCNPTLVEEILIQNFTSFHDRSESKFEEPLMKTLFNARGESWRIMRSKLNPSFTSTKVKGMFDQIIKCCDLITCQIEDQIMSSKPVDVGSLMFVYATEVIASCAFGVQLLSNSEQKNKFKTAIDNVFSFNLFRAIRIAMFFVFPKLVNFLGIKVVYRSVSDFFINLTKDSIRHRKQNNIKRNDFLNLLMELKDREESAFEVDEDGSISQEDTLTSSFMKEVHLGANLLQKEQMFTEDRIAALVFNFITGGLRPVVSTLSSALLEVAKSPDIQKKVFEEIYLTIRKHKGWTYEAVRDMEYLDKVIQETLRMHNLTTVLIRIVTEPYTLTGTTLTLEKDLLVYVPLNPLHMDPQHYPSPDVFNPDRFSDSSYKPTPFFMPFGNGPRICIAMKFATTTMKVCLARVLFEYSVKISDKIEMDLKKSDVFPNPIWLSFCKRKKTI